MQASARATKQQSFRSDGLHKGTAVVYRIQIVGNCGELTDHVVEHGEAWFRPVCASVNAKAADEPPGATLYN